MKQIAAVLLAFPLAGCFAGQQQKVAACKLEAMRLYPDKDDRRNDVFDYTVTCMKAHGFEYDTEQPKCSISMGSYYTAADPHCYIPIGWVQRLIYRIETDWIYRIETNWPRPGT